MKKDIYFTPDEVTLSNLDRLADLDNANTELRIMELGDLFESIRESVDAMVDLEFGLFDILSFISDRLNLPLTRVEDGVDDGIDKLKRSYISFRDNLDRAALASILSEYTERIGYSDTDFLIGEDMPGVFTYVKNVFADEAYDVLSQDFDDPRVRYSRDFSECIKQLLSGEVSYILLPFEERGGIRLPTVEELIFRNDLKVCAVTPVFGPDGMQDLKYALVSDRFSHSYYSGDDDRYLEIRVPESLNLSLSDVMSAAKFFGHTVYRVNTLSITSDNSEGQLFSIVFRADGRQFTSLLTYLTLFTTDYFIVGIYKNLE